MKELLFTSMFIIFFCIPQTKAQDAKQDFTVVNATGFAIDQLYVSPHGEDEWEDDILGQDILLDEEECDIFFEREEDNCVWDLKIVDEEGDEVEWEKMDLCRAIKVVLYWQDGKAWADIEEVQE